MIPGRRGRSGVGDDARAAVRGTVALAASQVGGRALGLAFVLIATRVLSPPQFGRYATVAAVLVGASMIADLGTTSVITKLVSRSPEHSSTILGATMLPCAALGSIALVALAVFGLVARYPMETRIDLLIAGIGLPADAALTSLLGGFDGRGLIARRARLSLARVATIAGGGLIALVATADVRPAITMLGVGPILTLLLSVLSARRHGVWSGRLLLDWDLVRKVSRQALPFALLGGINVIVLRADVVILSLLTPPAEVARYDVALRATESLTFIGTIAAGPSLFILSRRIGRNDIAGAQRAYNEAIRAAYLVSLPTSAMLVILGTPIARLMFGTAYASSGPLLSILGLQLWLAVVAAIQGSLLLAGEGLQRAVRLFGATAIAAIFVDILAIAAAQATGAAMALVLIQLSIVFAAAVYSRSASGIALPLPPQGAVLATLTSAAAMAAMRANGLAQSLVVGGIVYVAIIVATRTVSREEVAYLIGHLRRASSD